MAKKARKLTEQEALLTEFSKHSICSSTTFHPDQWGNGREPADIIIKINRALLFINATAGKQYFEFQCDHNINQARDRIAEWEGGKILRGRNEFAEFSISWSDVDVIHVISVADGPYSACRDHPIADLKFPRKITLCTTLTSRVIMEVVQRGGGARDLISVSKQLKGRGVVSDVAARRLPRKLYESIAFSSLDPYRVFPKLNINDSSMPLLKAQFDDYRLEFQEAQRQTNIRTQVLSDLSWADLLPMFAFMKHNITEMALAQDGQVRVKTFGSVTKITLILSSNMEYMAANAKKFYDMAAEQSASVIYNVFLHTGWKTCILGFPDKNGAWATETELLS